MIQRLLDISEHKRPLAGLGLTSIGQRWMNTLLSTCALAMYLNLTRLSGIRSMGSYNP